MGTAREINESLQNSIEEQPMEESPNDTHRILEVQDLNIKPEIVDDNLSEEKKSVSSNTQDQSKTNAIRILSQDT